MFANTLSAAQHGSFECTCTGSMANCHSMMWNSLVPTSCRFRACWQRNPLQFRLRQAVALPYRKAASSSATASHEDAEEDLEPRRVGTILYERKYANSVNLIGRTSRPVTLKEFGAGRVLGSTAIAVKSGTNTDWYDCDIWGSLAHDAAERVSQGTLVLVSGRLKQDRWEDKSTGQPRSKTKVLVEGIWLVEYPDALQPLEYGQADSGASSGDMQQGSSYDILTIQHAEDADMQLQQHDGLQQDDHQQVEQWQTTPTHSRRRHFQRPFSQGQQQLGLGQSAAAGDEDDVVRGNAQQAGNRPFAQLLEDYADAPIANADPNNPEHQKWLWVFNEPDEWYDNRPRKSAGEMNPKAPDFSSRKKGSNGYALHALWIDNKRTPAWVAEHVEFLDRQKDAPF